VSASERRLEARPVSSLGQARLAFSAPPRTSRDVSEGRVTRGPD
jgi:hypothetical protein